MKATDRNPYPKFFTLGPEELLRRILRALPRVLNYRYSGIRWSAVGAVAGLGSTSATELCRWAGLDPDDEIGLTQWEALEQALMYEDEMDDDEWERVMGVPWPCDVPKRLDA